MHDDPAGLGRFRLIDESERSRTVYWVNNWPPSLSLSPLTSLLLLHRQTLIVDLFNPFQRDISNSSVSCSSERKLLKQKYILLRIRATYHIDVG